MRIFKPELLDELPMIYGTCVFLYSLHHHTCPPKTHSQRYVAFLITCSVSVTVIYLLWPNPIFHQVCYGSLVALVLYEAIIACRNHPPIKPIVMMSAISYAFGFFLWNIDNHFCSTLRSLRSNSSPYSPLQVTTQLHAWWHIFVGYGTYLHVVFSSYARLLHLKKNCAVKKLGGFWPYMDIEKCAP